MDEQAKKPHSAVFLHIQKTAGSSIVDLALNAYGFSEVVSHGDYLKGCSDSDLLLDNIVNARGVSPEYFNNKTFVSGHFGYDFSKPLLTNRYSFTFLRDPIERVLSYYYFCLTRDPHEYEIYALVQTLSLDEFLMLGLERPAIKACIWNNQVWQLACGYGNSCKKSILDFTDNEMLGLAIEHLKEFSYIGFTETFDIDSYHILKSLGIDPPADKVVSNANPARPEAHNLPQSTIVLLNELTHLDRALYKEAWIQKEVRNGK